MGTGDEAEAAAPGRSMDVARFFDTRAAYMMFTTATNEKAVVAGRIGDEIELVQPRGHALKLFDAGMGDGSLLSNLMQRLHQAFPHVPWLVVAKEISIEDVRLALDRLCDRFVEHPEMVFVVTNMYFREAPALLPRSAEVERDLVWRSVALEGATAHDFARQIRSLYPALVDAWAVRTSPRTGNPLYVKPAALVIYRKDREFLLDPVIPRRGGTDGRYDLVVASQPYRAHTSAEHKVKTVVAPLARALAPGGVLVAVHSYGNDPGLEIVRGVWPHENPFTTDRRGIRLAARDILDQPGDAGLRFEDMSDEAAVFRYELHSMPSEVREHIGTSLIVAAWNAAAYVAQIDEARLAEATASGAYVKATRDVIRRHEGIWFNDEIYVITRTENATDPAEPSQPG